MNRMNTDKRSEERRGGRGCRRKGGLTFDLDFGGIAATAAAGVRFRSLSCVDPGGRQRGGSHPAHAILASRDSVGSSSAWTDISRDGRELIEEFSQGVPDLAGDKKVEKPDKANLATDEQDEHG